MFESSKVERARNHGKKFPKSSHLYSRAANRKNCAVFHTSSKFGVPLRYRTHVDIVPTNTGNIEVAPRGFLDFWLRFLYKVKIVKLKSIPGQNCSHHMKEQAKLRKMTPFPSPYDTPVTRYNRSKIKKLVTHARYTKCLFEHEL